MMNNFLGGKTIFYSYFMSQDEDLLDMLENGLNIPINTLGVATNKKLISSTANSIFDYRAKTYKSDQ